MTDKSDQRWRDKLDIPEPERVVGRTSHGDPIFMDMRELFSSPGEDAQRWAQTIDNRRTALVDKVAHLVLKNAALFLESTFWNTASPSARQVYESGDPVAAFKSASAHGFEAIQDGLKTIIKKNGKIIRDMDARISPALAPLVARRVSEIIHSWPMPKSA